MMTEEELFDAIDGLMAYDHGAASSGIRDEVLRRKVIDRLKEIAADGRARHQIYSRAFSELMGRFIAKNFVSPTAFDQGYGFEDLTTFTAWIQNQLGYE